VSRVKVLVTRKLPESALKMLDAFDVTVWPEEETAMPRDLLLKEVADKDAVLTMLSEKVDREFLDSAGRLKLVANMAVGYDNIDVPLCTSRGIVVTNTPGVLTDATADLAFSLLMATARRIPEAEEIVRSQRWKGWSPMFLTGQEVWGTTLGIVGMGRIGEAVARRARGFNMEILYYSRSRKEKVEQELGARFCSLDDLLRNSDYVSIHVPLTSETRGLIGERELKLMKPTAVLVNTSRGPVVDEKALVQALRERWIWGAGLDVFEVEPLPASSPLRELPNVVLLPHIGSATIRTRLRMAETAAGNIKEYLLGRKPLTPVNPQVLKG